MNLSGEQSRQERQPEALLADVGRVTGVLIASLPPGHYPPLEQIARDIIAVLHKERS